MSFAFQITCLDEVVKHVDVTNISPIPARVHCSVKSKHGYFMVQNPDFTLEGGMSTAIRVVAAFSEAIAVAGQLLISVVDGQDALVTLKGQVRLQGCCSSWLLCTAADCFIGAEHYRTRAIIAGMSEFVNGRQTQCKLSLFKALPTTLHTL